MVKKELSLHNYLELLDFETIEFKNFDPQSEDQKKSQNNEIQSKKNYYPFNKQDIFNFIQTEKFLSSLENIGLKENVKSIATPNNPIDLLKLRQILSAIPDQQKQKGLEFEKRRRYQTYKLLDYYLSHFTYFDFFSYDLFQIAKASKYLAQVYKKEKVSLSLLFLSCLDSTLASGKILRKFGFNEKFVEKFSMQLKNKIDFKTQLKFSLFSIGQKDWKKVGGQSIFFSKKIYNDFLTNCDKFFSFSKNKNFFLDQTIDYDFEVNQIYEKSSQNALERFKTPIITSEILLITIMENKNSTISKILQKIIPDQTKWYIFRYKLLKRLYNQEINLRTQIPRNQHFFAYLLKTKISGSNFELLMKKKLLTKAVSLFRNVLISELINNDLTINFEKETFLSIFSTPERKYS